MQRTLLATTCSRQADGSYYQQNTYYDPARRLAQQSALDSEESSTFTCAPFQIAGGVKLDEYCAVDTSGNGVLRTVYSRAGGSGLVQLFSTVDAQSSLCSGACDLAITYQQATNTTGATLSDGKLGIVGISSHHPINCYVPGLGNPTTTDVLSGGEYSFTYLNVPPGSYAAQLQDGNNCQLSTNSLVVNTGATTVGGSVTWFKYQYKDVGLNTPQLTGYAWNKVTKQGYAVAGLNINYPMFNLREPFYPQGSIVFWPYHGAQRYFRAKLDLHAAPSGDNVTPQEDALGLASWELVNDGYHYEINGTRYTIETFNSQLNTPQNFTAYAQGSIVRYRYNDFYRAKQTLDGRNYYNQTLPFPTVGASNAYWEHLPNYSLFTYLVPESQAVDSYQYGTATRRVGYYARNPAAPTTVPTATVVVPAADAGDYVLLNDTQPDVESNLGDLQLIDLIKNDVDEQGAENGNAWLVAQSPSLPLSFHLVNGVRAGYPQDNATGIYENLPAGQYQVYISDAASRQLIVDFTIEDRYRLRWRLLHDDLSGTKLETRVFQRDWAGGVTDLVGTDAPVVLSWDSGSDPGGALPTAVGAALQFNLRTQLVQQFVDTALQDDRFHRVDFLRGDQLRFRGYVTPDSYSEALLGPGQPVTITATCGLGKLRETLFIDYYDQRQTARTNMLSIVLKILSFCDVNLPVHCGLNLREQLMAADADPLQAAWVHRDAYDKKNGKYLAYEDFIDCRTVLDNILALFNAQLFQADGAWHIIGLNEVHDLAAAVRVWSPAGTHLTGVATAVPPLRVLPFDDATAPRELYWLRAEQVRNTFAPARLVKAVVDLKLETSLFDNGDFALWNNDRPTYWATQGSIAVAKAKAEKVHEFAVKFSGYDTTFTAGNYLLSPAVPHVTGQQEDYQRLKLRAIVDPATVNPTPSTLTLFVQLVCDGTPYLNPIPVPMSSADGWKDYSVDLPLGLPGSQLRVRLLEPVLDLGSPASTLRLSSAALSIQPGQYDWSSLSQDFEEAENAGITTGIQLPDVEVANADLPLLPALNGNLLPAKAMDVYAWRHAVSLADYTPTTAWKRPGYPTYTSLLHNVAQDRLALRYAPIPVLVGEVAGPGINYLRVGMMVDFPQDLDGKYYLTDCAINEREGSARVTARLLADGTYDGAYPVVPNNVRVAKVLNRFGYRVSVVAGTQGFRIAHK